MVSPKSQAQMLSRRKALAEKVFFNTMMHRDTKEALREAASIAGVTQTKLLAAAIDDALYRLLYNMDGDFVGSLKK